MQTLSEIKERLTVVIAQISNEKLTGDSFTDYKIRYATGELYAERNRLKLIAFQDFGASL